MTFTLLPARASRFRPFQSVQSGVHRILRHALALAAAATLAWCPAAPAQTVLPVVEHLDWQRYAGRWYEVARLPNSFQRKCVSDVTADYEVMPGGAVKVVNQCRREDGDLDAANGEARPVQGDVGKLKVRFAPRWLAWLPAVWGDYWVIAVDDAYQTALVGTPDREYLWLLSRSPQRAQADIDAWLQRAAVLGFDIDRVLRTGQGAANPRPGMGGAEGSFAPEGTPPAAAAAR